MKNLKLIISSLLILGTILGISSMSTPQIAKAAYTVRTEHPRIWLNSDNIETLRSRMRANTPEWQALKARADWAYASTTFDVAAMEVPNLALAYQMYKGSNDTQANLYATKALKIMRGYLDQAGFQGVYPCYATNPSPPYANCQGYAPGYHVRSIAPPIAVGYDWLYDYLSAEEKTAFSTKLVEWRNWYVAYGAVFRAGMDNWNSEYALSEMVAGLAIHGDNPNSTALIDHARNNYWMNRFKPFLEREAAIGTISASYNYGKYTTNTAPDYPNYILQSGAAGGFLTESTSYGAGSSAALVRMMEALRTAAGEDLFTSSPWFEGLAKYLINFSLPGVNRVLPFGEMSSQPTGSGLGDRALTAMLPLQREFSYTLGPQIQTWLKAGRGSAPPAYAFLWYDPSITNAAMGNFNTDYLVNGNHFIFSRSDWTTTATWVNFQAGDNFLGRLNAGDYGTFSIFKNGWLLPEAGGTAGGSGWHNVALIDGIGQKERMYRPGAKMRHYQAENDFVYAVSKLDNAYYDDQSVATSRPLTMWYRTFVYLKPDYVVVFDRMTANPSTRVKRLYFQYPFTQPTKEGNLITAVSDNGKGKLFQKVLLPVDATIGGPSSHNATSDKSNVQWYASVRPNSLLPTQATDQFLNVFQASDATVTAMDSTVKIDSDEGTSVGTQIGDRVVMFASGANQIDGSVTYSLASSTGISKQLLTGLRVSFPYTVTKNGGTSTMTSSDQGTLAFDVILGSSNIIKVEPQNVPSISITKSADKSSAKSGDIITYTLNYSNSGTVGATNAKIEDPIPVGTTFESIASGGATYDSINKKVILNIGSLAAGATGTIQFKVKVN